MEKILVTGGAGFIGSHVVDRLIEEEHEVIIIDNLSTGKEEFINPLATFYYMNIQDKKIEEIFQKEKPTTIIHLAAQIDVRISVEKPLFDAEVNVVGSINLLENAKKYKIKKFIFSSTGGALYGENVEFPTKENTPPHPISPYGASKLAVEGYIYYYSILHHIDATILRYSNVYGPRQDGTGEAGVVAIFVQNLREKKTPIIYGNGEQTRDFVYVDDVVEANILSLKGKGFRYYNVATGIETSVNELLRKISKIMNEEINPKYAPPRMGEISRSVLDIQKIKTELKWEPKVNLDKGLKKTIEWFKKKR
jgi:UDP-glucose 4-epimerase